MADQRVLMTECECIMTSLSVCPAVCLSLTICAVHSDTGAYRVRLTAAVHTQIIDHGQEWQADHRKCSSTDLNGQ